MAPKAKKGGGGGRTFRETPTEAHVAALELRAQVAEAAALELRERRRRLLSDVVDDGDGEPTREQAGGEGRRD